MFSANDVVNINKRFSDGHLANKNSLEFAISSIKHKTSLDQISYLVRAIVVDHVFSDGNKRTAAAILIAFFIELEIGFDPDKIAKIILDISRKNISDINKIRRMIKNAIR